MTQPRPAWSRDSVVLRQPARVVLTDLSPEWAFGGADGAGVRVAVVDSGIEVDHPLLGGCVDESGAVEFTVNADGEVLATQGPHGDAYGHGTACAGIIHQLAPRAGLTSLRVLGAGLTGKAAAFHAGLSWAVDQGFDVINLSLGTTKKDWALAFHDICDRAYFGNSFIVTAANNVSRVSYPSLFASVASVACNTSTDPHRFHANPEPPTEFLARGIDVEVPWLGGTTTRTTGNSFAAPHIAGLAALVKSKHPDLRPFQLKTVLWATVANIRESTPIPAAGRRGTLMATAHRGTMYRTVVRSQSAGDAEQGPHEGAAAVPDQRRVTQPPSGTSRTSDGRAVARWTAVAAALPELDLDAEIEPGTTSGPSRTDGWCDVLNGSWRATGQPVAVHLLDGLPAPTAGRVLQLAARVADLAHPSMDELLLVRPAPPAVIVALRHHRPTTAPGGATDAQAAREILLGAVSALAALHGCGIVHGDLRPADAWLDGDGRVRLGGLLRGAVSPSSSILAAGRGLTVAAIEHLAPEQIEGGAATSATDVHALGMLACVLFAGRLPYDPVERVGELLRQRLRGRPHPFAVIAPGCPWPIASAIDCALSIRREDRWSDAGALLGALERALS